MNIPLLRKVMEHITAHPEEYDQREYAVRTECGTKHCIAGWAVVLADNPEINYPDVLYVWDHRTATDFSWRARLGSIGQPWSRRAEEVLGLTWGQGVYLFHERRTLDEIWSFVEEISDGEIRRDTN